MLHRFMKMWLWTSLMLSLLLPVTIYAEDIYAQVKADIRADRTEIALKTLRGMVKSHPDDYQAWFLYGVANAHQQRDHEAIEAFRHVIDLNPELAEPHDNLAVIYNKMGDERAAIKELEQSLKKRPDHALTEENLADLYVKMAIKNYRRALKKEPTPQLERRYMRLLQVRNPDLSASEQERVTAIPVPASQQSVHNDGALSAPVPVEATAAKREPIDKPLPETSVAGPAESAGSEIDGHAVATTEEVATETAKIDRQAIEQKVLKAVEAWRSAWAGRSLADYFSAYAEDFQVPARFKTRADWQAYKRYVIKSKEFIEVEISDVKVELDDSGNRAHVKFFQKFRSNSYNGAGPKVLEMRLDSGAWKIVKEDSGS